MFFIDILGFKWKKRCGKLSQNYLFFSTKKTEKQQVNLYIMLQYHYNSEGTDLNWGALPLSPLLGRGFCPHIPLFPEYHLSKLTLFPSYHLSKLT